MTWEQALEAFDRYLEAERAASPRTRSAYSRDLAELRSFLEGRSGARRPGRLDSDDVRAYLAHLYRRLSPASIGRKLAALRSFFRFLVRRGFVVRDPAAAVRSPRAQRPLPKVLSVDDAFRVVEAPREGTLAVRDAAMLELMYGSGLRVSELVGSDVADVDLDAGVMRVRGKGRKEREVPLGEISIDAIRRYLPERLKLRRSAPDSDALFLGRRGRRIGVRQVQKLVARYSLAAAGRRIGPHACGTRSRRTCSTTGRT